jgi:hypothetical protein
MVLPPISVELAAAGRHLTADGKAENVDLVDGKDLQAGDEFQVRITPQQDCCLYVLWLTAKGEVAVLHPASDPKNARVPRNAELILPGPDRFSKLDAGAGNSGQDILYVAASYEPPEGLCRLIKQAALHKSTPASEWVKAIQATSHAAPPKGFVVDANGISAAPTRHTVKVSDTQELIAERVIGEAGLSRKLVISRRAQQ